MTNGTLTKKIMSAAKTLQGEELLNEAKRQMRRFPLSSEKLLYDNDKGKVSPEAWDILLQAAVETDKEKFEDCNRMLVESGCEPYTSFGRYDTQPEQTAKMKEDLAKLDAHDPFWDDAD